MLNIADDPDEDAAEAAETSGETTREVECALTETEVRERGEAMAAAERECERLKVRRRALNVQIRGHLDRMTELAKVIESRTEMREVTCVWRPDYQRKLFELLQKADVGKAGAKVIETRVMTAADLQGRLPGVDRADAERAEADEDDEAEAEAEAEAELGAFDEETGEVLPLKARATVPAKRKAKANKKKGER